MDFAQELNAKTKEKSELRKNKRDTKDIKNFIKKLKIFCVLD
jgi:hypothetical protein